ncbi:MetQ/NlpA family ABC transporter substrate-binding protein [Corynebacterium pseudodiphtheriticum]|uniref:MetQ/NlpA family ABC transporter substrate-binding protein n=1 Tax=Corynebacterium pseudodiphtheriticum TaxID=37637 RepID=UPI00234D368C|nr:MetQ/NlpA family ABC transporter substrate-binding protein [Corynebacterium pseudodiphtheriticum]MDC7087679.1 MetQ/NlpA family ABC transporter substrate-binding protein [Corynebacterium pseudodiphtheriticum]MDK4322478.1 MetQ/NlpA family ABC transporter substrate-binding protein [Corynebacterium pseudodiphtheriticum]
MKIRRIIAGSTAALTAATLVACSSDDSANSANGEGGYSKDDTIVIGTTDASMPSWAVFEEVAEEHGFNIDLRNFAEYSTPNPALTQGELDTNKFQHLMYLAQHNIGSGDDLAPLVSTEIYPLGLYWKDAEKLDVKEIEGEEIAIPNDTVNQGRALLLLQEAGLIKLTGDSKYTPTPADIDKDASKVTVTPIDAAQTARLYGEGRPAVINNSFLEKANIDPKEAIFEDDPNGEGAEPYINLWAVRADDVDDAVLNELAELWHDERVAEAVREESGGTAVQVKRSRAELQEILDKLEEELQQG